MKKITAVIILILSFFSAVYSAYAHYNTKPYEIKKVTIGDTFKTTLLKYEDVPYFEDFTRSQGKYEPENGTLAGAYILSDSYCSRDILKFEQMTATSHSFYTYTLKTDSPFPHRWVQQCISLNKIPYIIILPDKKDPLNTAKINEISKEMGKHDTKNFISIYPDPSSVTDLPQEYIDFFNTSKNFFLVNSPKTALIWLSSENYEKNSRYFCENADWAGIFMYERISTETLSEKKEEFNKFYENYQRKLPLMVFYGVSHYNSSVCRYYTTECAEHLNNFYTKLITDYPCIKGICYTNFDGNAVNKSPDNFLLTDTDEILYTYTSTLSNKHFTLETPINNTTVTIKIRQPFNLKKYNKKIYFPLKYYFKNYNKYDIIYIDGEKYLPYSANPSL